VSTINGGTNCINRLARLLVAGCRGRFGDAGMPRGFGSGAIKWVLSEL